MPAHSASKTRVERAYGARASTSFQPCCGKQDVDGRTSRTNPAMTTQGQWPVAIPGSSNGRMRRSGRRDAGSSPAPGSNSIVQPCCGDRNGNGRACKARRCGFESRPQLQSTKAWVADEVIAPD